MMRVLLLVAGQSGRGDILHETCKVVFNDIVLLECFHIFISCGACVGCVRCWVLGVMCWVCEVLGVMCWVCGVQ